METLNIIQTQFTLEWKNSRWKTTSVYGSGTSKACKRIIVASVTDNLDSFTLQEVNFLAKALVFFIFRFEFDLQRCRFVVNAAVREA